MYVVRIIYGETLQKPATVPAENLRRLTGAPPKKNKALWVRSSKYATSMAGDDPNHGPSKRHKVLL